MRRAVYLGAVGGLLVVSAWAQTTQGIIAGQAIDKLSGAPLAKVKITASMPGVEEPPRETDERGFYIFPLLSPGVYEIRAERENYQSQVIAEQELPVAGRLEVNFQLRPLYDLYSSQTDRFSYARNDRLIHFYATDAEKFLPAEVAPADAVSTNLGSSLSYVIDSRTLEGIPLRGHDAYALLVALPGVTADPRDARTDRRGGSHVTADPREPRLLDRRLDRLPARPVLVTRRLRTRVQGNGHVGHLETKVTRRGRVS